LIDLVLNYGYNQKKLTEKADLTFKAWKEFGEKLTWSDAINQTRKEEEWNKLDKEIANIKDDTKKIKENTNQVKESTKNEKSRLEWLKKFNKQFQKDTTK
jgi:hypothetical protein